MYSFVSLLSVFRSPNEEGQVYKLLTWKFMYMNNIQQILNHLGWFLSKSRK